MNSTWLKVSTGVLSLVALAATSVVLSNADAAVSGSSRRTTTTRRPTTTTTTTSTTTSTWRERNLHRDTRGPGR